MCMSVCVYIYIYLYRMTFKSLTYWSGPWSYQIDFLWAHTTWASMNTRVEALSQKLIWVYYTGDNRYWIKLNEGNLRNLSRSDQCFLLLWKHWIATSTFLGKQLGQVPIHWVWTSNPQLYNSKQWVISEMCTGTMIPLLP
jgi:hypothetical protein